jgi:protein-arginine kinase activator protein McsA
MNQSLFSNNKGGGQDGSLLATSRQLMGQDYSLKDLSMELEIALSEENYEKAAIIRDKIKECKKISSRM